MVGGDWSILATAFPDVLDALRPLMWLPQPGVRLLPQSRQNDFIALQPIVSIFTLFGMRRGRAARAALEEAP